MKFMFPSIVAVPIAFFANYGLASDEALYGAEAPQDAVLVRFLGTPSEGGNNVYGWNFETEEADPSYSVISAALLSNTPETTFTTVFVDEQGREVVFHEPDRTSSSKVHLLLMNATNESVSLVANDGALEVIGDTEFAKVGMRAVNPISVELSVVRGPDLEVVASFDVSLRRGEDISFVVTDDSVEMVPTSYGAVITD
ncbi:alginate O-acetyltransferase AlgF [Loktanella sp. Alg231-35]|uniref:alginate O-acetyltransferase AlgF n=1 Tax=Loktanella sp. Alg231-35 TaxID=1922220 RepID=UPI000D55133A|nr:alginate O-acetyltransferase AlgF [Loktanella sp. Alg231-35]